MAESALTQSPREMSRGKTMNLFSKRVGRPVHVLLLLFTKIKSAGSMLGVVETVPVIVPGLVFKVFQSCWKH